MVSIHVADNVWSLMHGRPHWIRGAVIPLSPSFPVSAAGVERRAVAPSDSQARAASNEGLALVMKSS
jgi:hypothetical protein